LKGKSNPVNVYVMKAVSRRWFLCSVTAICRNTRKMNINLAINAFLT